MRDFKTFFIGGYECADMINNRRKRVNLLTLTGHDIHTDEDYRMLSEAGMHTVREGIVWSAVEKEPYVYDWTEVRQRMESAKKWGIQQLWDICHFGYPDGLTPLQPDFGNRFVAICKAFTELYYQHNNISLIVTPINEISFLSFLSGDVEGTVPFLRHSGGSIKYELCKAAIKGIEAIKAMAPSAKIMMVEPFIRIHSKGKNDNSARILQINQGQFEAMDMITGRMHPELGGKPEYMDFAGFNYYYNNHWEHCGRKLCWKRERQRTDLPGWLKRASDRYGKPVVISETGHFKEDRSLWMRQITEDLIKAMNQGVDLRGVCIYPVLDRPDWDTMKYIACGIWGYDKKSTRTVEADYLQTVRECHDIFNDYLAQRAVAKSAKLRYIQGLLIP